jgi:hypothetical protein
MRLNSTIRFNPNEKEIQVMSQSQDRFKKPFYSACFR